MKKGMLKKVMALSLVSVMALGLMACGKKEESKTTLQKIKDNGKIVMGTSPDFPPFEFKDTQGNVVGMDVSIAQEVAKDLGVKLEIKEMDFDGLLPALQGKKFDMILSGMTPKEERKQNADFSNLYYKTDNVFVVKAENKDKYTKPEDFNGKKIGVQKGTVQEDTVKEKITNPELNSLGKTGDVIMNLKSGKIDGVLLEQPVAEAYVAKNPDLALSSAVIKDQVGGYAIAMAKGDTDLQAAINKTLDRLEKEGKLKKFFDDANALAGE
ncbi:transporter substrate-binding domain-containing protein [Clostridium paridis]|uniref:Transporter substrate-binding domain-containing protein n=1 Tax=Clostridium paridis TaxID=2803863 RepID=A0A937FA65_9CLOT|nr:transporter substrate-binding domain-containing protein [Clostridium paridis]MBL4930204.1 transporter substrate-binding domain-containing protein [Clostridium paridis]